MTSGRLPALRTIFFTSLSLVALTLAADLAGVLRTAQAQTTPEEKKDKDKKKGPDKGKAPPPKSVQPPPGRTAPPGPPPEKKALPNLRQTPPPPPEKKALPNLRQTPPPPEKKALPGTPQTPPPPEKKALPGTPQTPPPPEKKALPGAPHTPPPPEKKALPNLRQMPPPPEKKALPGSTQPPATGQPQFKGPGTTKESVGTPDQKKDGGPRQLPQGAGPGPSNQGPGVPKTPDAAAGAKQPPPGAAFSAAPGPRRFDEVQKGRQERSEDGGRRKIIHEPGNRIIVKENNRAVIRHDEADRFRRLPGSKSERGQNGVVQTFYVRPDGVRVVTEVDANGRLLRRYRRGRDGREVNLIDNRRFYRNIAIGVGVGAGIAIALNLARPRVSIPHEKYIVDYDRASDEDLDEVLLAGPIERLDRGYSLEEIRYSHELREYTRRVDLDITFEFGVWEVGPDQYPKLERLARSLLRALRRNPDLVFLVEGHTDAVGSDVDNLSLSDRRAASVAEALSEQFGVPPENLVTQGYGEQYLKVDTQGPEQLNRRVAVRNISGLMADR